MKGECWRETRCRFWFFLVFGFSKCTTAPPLAEPRWLSFLQRGGIPGKVKSGAFGRVAQTKEPGVHQNGGRNDSLAVYSRPKAHTHTCTHTRGPALATTITRPILTLEHPTLTNAGTTTQDTSIAVLVDHFYVDRTHYSLQLQTQSAITSLPFPFQFRASPAPPAAAPSRPSHPAAPPVSPPTTSPRSTPRSCPRRTPPRASTGSQ